VRKWEDPDPDPESVILDPNPSEQIITDPGGSGSETLLFCTPGSDSVFRILIRIQQLVNGDPIWIRIRNPHLP